MTFCIYTLDGTLSFEIARRTLVQCTDVIIESRIDPTNLARKLYANEIISENIYKRVRGRACGDTTSERLDNILDEIKVHVIYDASIFTKFVDILRDLNRQDLADYIMSKYEGIIQIRNASNEN